MVVTIIIFIAILSLLVLIHELGHFLAAKKFGIKVEEFGFGFPPRLFGKKIGETLYSFNLLPIGGFVKLYGEDEVGGGKVSFDAAKENKETVDIKRAFFAKTPLQKMIVVVAGVTMNFLLALVIMSFLVGVNGLPQPSHMVFVSSVLPHSAAQQAGIQTGDKIIRFNHMAVTKPDEVIAITKQHLGERIPVTVEAENGKKRELMVTPKKSFSSHEGALGVSIYEKVSLVKYPWYLVVPFALKELGVETWMIISGLGMTISQLLLHQSVPQGIAGPVGIAQLTGQFVAIGPFAVLSLVAVLSLNLAILNILPIPALDGGRLFFILVEGIFGRKVDRKIEGYIHAVGMLLLLAMIIGITIHDILRIMHGQQLLPTQ